MAKLVALYKKPANVAEFDKYYFTTHVKIAKKVPGLRGYQVSTGAVSTPQGDSAYHLVAVLSVDSMAAMKPYWFIRTLAGVAMDIGAALGFWNLYMTIKHGEVIPVPANAPADYLAEPRWS